MPRSWLALGAVVAVVFIVSIAGFVFLVGRNGSGAGAASPGASGADAGTSGAVAGTIVEGRGGRWTDISPDTLASMLGRKDFTLLNVKTPYIGEIEGTDLYIPYTDLAARAAELPVDRGARIVVYCRSGNESAIAAQTLIDLGYTDVVNLAGGMNAWKSSGRPVVQVDRG